MDSKLKSFLRSDWGFIAICLLAGVAMRALHLADFAQSPLFLNPTGTDVEEYDQWARAIASGQLLWTEPQIHAPLYPYFLALLYKVSGFSLGFVRAFQSLLGLLAGIPVFFMLRDAVASSSYSLRLAPRLFIALWALFPTTLLYESELFSEALLLPLIVCSAWLLHEADKSGSMWKRLGFVAGGGLLAGLSVITHPLAILFVGLEATCFAWTAFRARCAKPLASLALLLAFAALPVVPVCIHNSHLAGRLAFVQGNSGFNVYLGSNPDANGTCYLRPGPEWDKCHADAQAEATKLGASKDSIFIAQSLNWIKEHPLSWAWLTAKKAVYAVNCRELPTSTSFSQSGGTFTERHLGVFFGFALALAFMGLATEAFRKGSGMLPGFKHVLLIALAFWLAQALFVAGGRYRLPMHPAALALATCVICALFLESLPKGSAKKLVAIYLAAVALVFLPCPKLDYPRLKAEANSVLAEAYMKADKLPEALAHLDNSAAILMSWDRTCNLRGQILASMGRQEEALKAYFDATKRFPDSYYAYMNIAAILSKNNDPKTAESLFGKALKIKPDSPDLLYNVALFAQEQKQLPKAIELYRACLKLSPAHRRALNNLGAALLMSGDAKGSADCFARALALDPGNTSLMVNLAAARLSLGEKAKARELLLKALKLAPKSQAAATLLKSAE